MTALDLDAIKARAHNVATGHAAGGQVWLAYNINSAEDVPALVAEVERQAATIAKAIEAMDAIPRSMYSEDVVRILRTGSVLIGPPVTRSSDSSSTGGKA